MPQQPLSRGAQAALLTWVNTFDLDRKVDRLEDLADGHVLAQMLQDLDPEFDPAELEQNAGSSSWLTNKRNMQTVFKAFTKYVIHKDTSGTAEFLPRTIDFRAVSDNLNADGLAQIVALFLAAAMLGDHNTKYIPIMRHSLTTSEQAEIMAVLQRKDDERQRLAESGTDTALDETTDPGLVAEAQLAALAGDYDRLSKRLADTNTRLEHLQISYELMKEELERKEKELDLARQKYGASESQLIRDLHEKLRERDDLISTQEAQAEDDRLAKQRLGQENAQLARKAALLEQLQDQVQELRHANEELSKKANTVDRYKQKLEAQRGLETDLQNALYELGVHKEALKELDALQKRSAQQQTTIERFREMVSGLEQQIEDSRLQRSALEGDIYAAHVQLESLKDQHQLGEARISELEQQLLQGGGGGGGGSAGPPSPMGALLGGGGAAEAGRLASSLEEELQPHAADPMTVFSREVTRLRAENNLLRSSAERATGAGSETERLRGDLEAARAKEELARHKHSELLEQHALLQAQVQALVSGDGAGAAMAATQQQLKAATAEREQYKAQAQELQGQVADGQRELLRLRADLGAVEKGSVDALAELKSADHLVAASLTRELASLRKDFRALQLDNEQQQKQLIEALVSKEELRKAMGLSAEAKPASPPSADGSGTMEEQWRKTAEKNEKLRAAMRLLKKQYDMGEQERSELQRRLRAAEQAALAAGGSGSAAGAAAYAAQRAAHEQVVRNLQRENAMIATAWYDLTSRLQSNHVVLQRRQDMPKSWLNKQRQMVNATPRK